MQIRLAPPQLIGRATLVIVAVAMLQTAASLLFYRAIDRETVREDHARRVAELLVVSYRLDNSATADLARIMTTSHLAVSVDASPTVVRQDADLAGIRQKVLGWEPELSGRALYLDTQGAHGRQHLIGSMQLSGERWLNFQSANLSAQWPIAARATFLTILFMLICLAIGMYILRLVGAPLRQLSEAAGRIGEGVKVSFLEHGTRDLRDVSRAFNRMQDRIEKLVFDQAKAFEAISHDLRTPLSRLKLAAGFVEPADMKELIGSSADEMEAMLASLQRFLRAQHLSAEPEQLDLLEIVGELRSQWGEALQITAPPRASAFTYREPLLLAISPLIENALQYGGRATLRLAHDEQGWVFELRDFGAGIPQPCLQEVLTPFVRLDEARARNTSGFGLGIPTAHRLLLRFGGSLLFRNHPEGGLVAVVRLPAAMPAARIEA